MEPFTIIRPPDALPQKLLAPTLACEPIAYDKANEEWGLNCGPAALCTMLMLPPEGVRKHVPGFEEKRYTSPTMMKAALASLGIGFREASPNEKWQADGSTRHCFPTNGLARIQFEGPWLDRGVPPAAAYKYTHWVGSIVSNRQPGPGLCLCIFDVNFLWQSVNDWAGLLPELIKEYKRATGGWTVTHRWQLLFP